MTSFRLFLSCIICSMVLVSAGFAPEPICHKPAACCTVDVNQCYKERLCSCACSETDGVYLDGFVGYISMIVGVLLWYIGFEALAAYIKDMKYKDMLVELHDLPNTDGVVTKLFRPQGHRGRTLGYTEVTLRYVVNGKTVLSTLNRLNSRGPLEEGGTIGLKVMHAPVKIIHFADHVEEDFETAQTKTFVPWKCCCCLVVFPLLLELVWSQLDIECYILGGWANPFGCMCGLFLQCPLASAVETPGSRK